MNILFDLPNDVLPKKNAMIKENSRQICKITTDFHEIHTQEGGAEGTELNIYAFIFY